MSDARVLSTSPCVLDAAGSAGELTPRGRPWSTAGARVEGGRIANAKLTNVAAGLRTFAEPLPHVRNLVLENCELRASWIRLVVLAESDLQFARLPLLNLFGVLFDRVVVRGTLASVIVQDARGDDGRADPRFERVRREHYERVPWALDLREARFSGSADVRNVPGTKCLLDPDTQGVAWREPAVALMRSGEISEEHPWWSKLRYSFDGASYGGDDFAQYDDVPLVVPRASRKRKMYQQGLDDLRTRGVVR